MKKIIYLLSFLPHLLIGQEVNLEILVKDAATKKGVKAVTITIMPVGSGSISKISDDGGKVVFKVARGLHNLSFEKDGYETKDASIEASGTTRIVFITKMPSIPPSPPIPVKTVEITVEDVADKRPLQNVIIELSTHKLQYETKADGKTSLKLPQIQTGHTFEVSYRKVGYKSGKKSFRYDEKLPKGVIQLQKLRDFPELEKTFYQKLDILQQTEDVGTMQKVRNDLIQLFHEVREMPNPSETAKRFIADWQQDMDKMNHYLLLEQLKIEMVEINKDLKEFHEKYDLFRKNKKPNPSEFPFQVDSLMAQGSRILLKKRRFCTTEDFSKETSKLLELLHLEYKLFREHNEALIQNRLYNIYKASIENNMKLMIENLGFDSAFIKKDIDL